jgi:catechol O-methyltransferase
VLTYCCCESSDLLVNYSSLPPDENLLSAYGLEFTRRFASAHKLTGPLAFDFIRSTIDGELYAIECNPRTHTAVVLFRDDPEWAEAYLAALSPMKTQAFLARRGGKPVVPKSHTPPAYWIGHELFDATRFQDMRTLVHRLLFEREAHWDERDPVPWLGLYHVQWPAVFVQSLLTGRRWTRMNASTGKTFWC